MALGLIKLCVGCDSVTHLAEMQARRLVQARARGDREVLRHVTRHRPRRASELVDGGSLYWVIKGFVQARQALAAIEETVNDRGLPACALILDPRLVRTMPRPTRPFQGWRYLESWKAPADTSGGDAGVDLLPPAMASELRALGLI